MKVQLTLELDDDQRVAVGLMETGQFVPASRAQVREFVTNESMAVIETATEIVKEQRIKLAAEVRRSIKPVASSPLGDS